MALEAEPKNQSTPPAETAWATAASDSVIAAGRSPRGVCLFVVTQLLVEILFQRIVFPGTVIEVPWVTLAAGLAVFWVFGEMKISRTRTVLFLMFASSVCISVLLAANEPSVFSVLLLMFCYSGYVVSINVTMNCYRRCMRFFVDVMVVFALIAIIQIGGQALTGMIVVPLSPSGRNDGFLRFPVDRRVTGEVYSSRICLLAAIILGTQSYQTASILLS